MSCTLSPETRQRIERAFVQSKELYQRDIEKRLAGQEPGEPPHNLDPAEKAWKHELDEIRERKSKRISHGFFAEGSRESIQRIIRKEIGGQEETKPNETEEAVKAVEQLEEEMQAVPSDGPKVDGDLPEVEAPPTSQASLHDRIKVKSLLKNVELITVPRKYSLRALLGVLADNDVSSVPVCHEGVVEGSVDLASIVKALVEDLRDDSSSHPIDHFLDTTTAGALCKMKVVKGQWYAVREDASLSQLIQIFASGVHRAVVLSPESRAIGVVSQRSLTHLFAAHSALLGSFGQMPVCEIPGAMVKKANLITVTASTPAWIAFHLMREHNVSGVGIVSDDGLLIRGEVSVRSIKGLRNERMHLLMRPLERFLTTGPYNMRLAVITKDKPLTAAFDKMVECKRERVWIVEPGSLSRLVGMVSMTSICQAMEGVAETE